MRTIIVFLGLVFLLGRVFPLTDFQLLLPNDMFRYPRQSLSNAEHVAILWGVGLGAPAVVVALYMWRSRLMERVQPSAGLTLLTIGVVIMLAQWAIRLTAATVPGGGGLYTADSLFVYAALPVKVLLLVGAVLLFSNLKPRGAPRSS